jgi:hypothetical protein
MTTARERLKRRFRKPPVRAVRGPAPREIAPESRDPGDWGPNEIAAARIMPPPLEILLARGLIEIEQYNAAKEIERVFHWVTSGLKSRIANLSEIRGGVGSTSDPLQAAYTARYRPWADELSLCRIAAPDVNEMARVLASVEEDDVIRLAAGATERRGRTRNRYHPKTLQFVIDFVIDDRTFEAIAREERHHHKTVRRAVLDGLTLYAQIAGWLRRAA